MCVGNGMEWLPLSPGGRALAARVVVLVVFSQAGSVGPSLSLVRVRPGRCASSRASSARGGNYVGSIGFRLLGGSGSEGVVRSSPALVSQ